MKIYGKEDFKSQVGEALLSFVISSFLHWQVQIVSLDEDTSEFTGKSTFDHPYPTTKIMWIPDTVCVPGHHQAENSDL